MSDYSNLEGALNEAENLLIIVKNKGPTWAIWGAFCTRIRQ